MTYIPSAWALFLFGALSTIAI